MQQHPWGIYVHIPYCPKICPYCDFNVVRRRAPPWKDFFAALTCELRARLSEEFAGMPPPVSLYFGGGTPSLAPAAALAEFIAAVRRHSGLPEAAEITLEANPGTVSLNYLEALRAAGVNRLSLGWQSTHDRLLCILGRTHDAAAGVLATEQARQAGFDNLNLDLIFAVPSQTRQECLADLQALAALRPQHVALYALTYHAGTPFYAKLQRGRLQAAPEELELQMMRDIADHLGAAGYAREEVSNFCLPGAAARHNGLYWRGGAYLGLGPGAHSFTQVGWQQGRRWENLRAPDRYIAAWTSPGRGSALQWREELTAEQLWRERTFCGLRCPTGIDLSAAPFAGYSEAMQRAATAACEAGWATLEGSHLRPTSRGLEQADSLAALF